MHFKKLGLILLAAQFIPVGKGLLKGYRKSGMKVERRTEGRRTHTCDRERRGNASTVSVCKTHPVVLPIYNDQVFFLNILLFSQQHRAAEGKVNTFFIFPISLYFPPLYFYINTENKHTHKTLQYITHRRKSHVIPTE